MWVCMWACSFDLQLYKLQTSCWNFYTTFPHELSIRQSIFILPKTVDFIKDLESSPFFWSLGYKWNIYNLCKLTFTSSLIPFGSLFIMSISFIVSFWERRINRGENLTYREQLSPHRPPPSSFIYHQNLGARAKWAAHKLCKVIWYNLTIPRM